MTNRRLVGGSSFRVVSFYNPLGMYPTRLYPIFSKMSDKGSKIRLYIEDIDNEGTVTDYFFIGISDLRELTVMGSRSVINAVGLPAVQAIAWEPHKIELFKGEQEFLTGVKENLYKNRRYFRKNPAAGVSLARMVSLDGLEALFAGMMIRRIARISLAVAHAWMSGARLSEEADSRAMKIYRIIKKSSTRLEQAPDIRTISFGSASSIQGDYLFTTTEGRLTIRLGNRIFVGLPPSG